MIARPALLVCLLAVLPQQAKPQSTSERGIGGLGLRPCAEFTGVENAPLLAQSADWMLGYMAGRIDGGDRRDTSSQLSTEDQFDLVTGIAGYCTSNPDRPLIDAARNYARGVFGTDPVYMEESAPPDRVPRPPSRGIAGPAARLVE